MVRLAERFRQTIGKTEIGIPRFSPEQRAHIIQAGREFVAEAKRFTPQAGILETDYYAWIPRPEEFTRPEKLGNNIHAHHNIRHTAALIAENMFLLPVVETIYKDNLPRPLMPNAVYASAKGHDLERWFDILGAFPDFLYKKHGEKMARKIREGQRFPQLSDAERAIAAQSVQFHDVDPRLPLQRNPEDEFLAITDRAELNRLSHGVGIVAKAARRLAVLTHGNVFEKRKNAYEPYFFPGFMQMMQPLSDAMLLLSLEGIKQGLTQADAVWFAVKELGMEKSPQEEKSAA